jgi:hypothetical protein
VAAGSAPSRATLLQPQQAASEKREKTKYLVSKLKTPRPKNKASKAILQAIQ